jgi:hypothetical protein
LKGSAEVGTLTFLSFRKNVVATIGTTKARFSPFSPISSFPRDLLNCSIAFSSLFFCFQIYLPQELNTVRARKEQWLFLLFSVFFSLSFSLRLPPSLLFLLCLFLFKKYHCSNARAGARGSLEFLVRFRQAGGSKASIIRALTNHSFLSVPCISCGPIPTSALFFCQVCLPKT